MLHACAAGFIIAHKAAQKPRIGGMYPVVVVYIQRCKRAYIHAEKLIAVYIVVQQHRV